MQAAIAGFLALDGVVEGGDVDDCCREVLQEGEWVGGVFVGWRGGEGGVGVVDGEDVDGGEEEGGEEGGEG